jgi:hypothetical protein
MSGWRDGEPVRVFSGYRHVIIICRYVAKGVLLRRHRCLLLTKAPIDPRDREIGERYFGPYKEAMGSHAQLLFERRLGMTAGEIHVLIAQARQELADLRLKPYIGL